MNSVIPQETLPRHGVQPLKIHGVTPLSEIELARDLRRMARTDSLAVLMERAAKRRDECRGALVTYSRKVFIPLTRLCRDVCSYCTFAKPPIKGQRCYLSPYEVLAIAHKG